jgi:hypothetical protein
MSNSKATLMAMIPGAVFIFLVIGLLQCDFVTVDAAAFQKEKEYTKEELLLFADFAFPNERIRKYDEDIRVVIKNKEYLNDASILIISLQMCHLYHSQMCQVYHS